VGCILGQHLRESNTYSQAEACMKTLSVGLAVALGVGGLAGTWYLSTVHAPLPVRGGTESPVNPIATF
jgi:hypothetical protein